MNTETIYRCQQEIVRELPWINKIENDSDYQSAIEYLTTESMIEGSEPFLIKLVTDLISDYEINVTENLALKNRRNETDNGLAALLTLMGHRKLKNLALVDVLGSTSLVSQIVNGKRSLTVQHIYSLAKYFGVKPSTFL